MKKIICACLFFVLAPFLWASDAPNDTRLSLSASITYAFSNDQWLQASYYREQAYIDQATSDSVLPDPTISVGLVNLPTDSFDFDQENMTQFKLAYTQRFPGGDSLDVKSRRSRLSAETMPFMRQDRMASVKREVSLLWLDGYLAAESIRLIKKNYALFEQLAELTEARYTSAVGRVKQQDLVRAQLQLTQLDDRLARLSQRYDANRQLLNQWLPSAWHQSDLQWQLSVLNNLQTDNSVSYLSSVVQRHPRLQVADKKVAIEQENINMAKEDYKSGWALNAGYAYRDNTPSGDKRADFVSLGVSFDLTLFSKNRYDKKTASARSRKQAVAIDYQLLERQLLAQTLKVDADIQRLQQRHDLYENRLLAQMHEQAEATLSAYTYDDGSFDEVVRAYIDELNSKIDMLDIQVKQQKSIAQMNYFLAGINPIKLIEKGESHE